VASTQQLLRLFPDDLTPLFIKLPSSLADRSNLGVHGQAVVQEIRSWDPAYVAPTLPVVNYAQGLVGTAAVCTGLEGWLGTPSA